MHDAAGRLAENILECAVRNRIELEASIEALLLQKLSGAPYDERIRRVEELSEHFVSRAEEEKREPGVDSGRVAGFLSLLLGKKLAGEGLTAEEMTQKYVEAFTTIFDTLNRIHTVIQTSLLGQSEELETIRRVIGAQIEKVEGKTSVREYLDKIQEAFLVAHTAFQSAAGNVVTEILKELAPEAIEASVKPGFRFGPLRKAELFERYSEKHEVLSKWVVDGHFNEKLLREFERICKQSYRV